MKTMIPVSRTSPWWTCTSRYGPALPAFRHKPAFIWAEEGAEGPSFLTYTQLNSAVHSISSALSQSLQKGDTVVILCQPGLELVEIIFACQRAGLIAVPVTPPHLSLANNHNHHHFVRLSQTKPCAALATRREYSSLRQQPPVEASRTAQMDRDRGFDRTK
ncbi:hypothetical protein SASPL_137862 [Salvia splendens]|uniref:AMP-dependent synthetase/ligase domain-containing protein n=1 Tax=Salvia splendens TaxID=180675 RepID=A0A8X8WU84_SALSN|nr:hypothetical protein SASPL_137862 [Salvia splendens]